MQTNDYQLMNSRPARGIAHLMRHEYGGGGDGGATNTELERQAKLDKGMTQIDDIYSKYDDNFYQQRGQAYTDYAMPQVMKQYGNAKNSLSYALARNGILKSGAAVARGQDLKSELDRNITNVANQAQNEKNQLRSQVQDAKGSLVNQLIASGDPSVVSSQGAAATAGLSAPSAFNSLGNMFSDWTNAYITNMNARAVNPTTPSVWQQLGSVAYN